MEFVLPLTVGVLGILLGSGIVFLVYLKKEKVAKEQSQIRADDVVEKLKKMLKKLNTRREKKLKR